jgi:GDP-L-fucose synthase
MRLLTGAKGLVGVTIDADIRIDSREQVDLRDWNATLDFFKDVKPTKVIHCAAKVGGLGANMNYMGEFFYDNMMINLNVLEAARQTNVEKVVSFLSTCIYPDKVEYPLTEEKIHIGPPHSSNYAYAYAKRMLDVQSRAYKKQYGLNYVCVVPTNIYGPHDNYHLENAHVVPALIHRCYLAKKNNVPLTVWGSGTPLREFIFSKDVGMLTEWALENYDDEAPIIFSNAEEVTIREMVELVVEAFEFTGEVLFDIEKPDGQFRKPTDPSRLLAHIPGFKFTPLKEGIKESVDWFIENYPNVRGAE